MAYGRRKTKAPARRASYGSARNRGSVRRSSRTKRSTARRAGGRVAPQTIRIVFAQEPGGAALANPALPIPPSITQDKTRKAKL